MEALNPQTLVIHFHNFLTSWFSGSCNNDALLSEELSRFDQNFKGITPTAREFSIESMRNFMPTTHGSDPGVKVSVHDFEEVLVSEEIVILRYKEKQQSQKQSSHRVATAVFKKNQNNWRWFYLHETWIPN